MERARPGAESMDEERSGEDESLIWAFRASVIEAMAHEERALAFGLGPGDESTLRRLWRQADSLAERLAALSPTGTADARAKREAHAWLSGESKKRRRSAAECASGVQELTALFAQVESADAKAALGAVGAVLAKAAHSAKRRAQEDPAALEALRALHRLGKRLQEFEDAKTRSGEKTSANKGSPSTARGERQPSGAQDALADCRG